MKDVVEIAKERQQHKFDCNIVVSGARGNGKSTFLYKFFSHFKQFKPRKHIVYARADTIRLLKELKFVTIIIFLVWLSLIFIVWIRI